MTDAPDRPKPPSDAAATAALRRFLSPAPRPTALDPAQAAEYADTVRRIGAKGGTMAEMAAALGASRTAMRTLARRCPGFAEALAQAKTLAEAWWDRLARQAT